MNTIDDIRAAVLNLTVETKRLNEALGLLNDENDCAYDEEAGIAEDVAYGVRRLSYLLTTEK